MKNFIAFKYHIAQVIPTVSDTDFGHGVYHGRYFALYDQARDNFFYDLGVPYRSLMKRNIYLVVAQLECKYCRPIFYDQRISVFTKLTWIKSKSFGIYQKMIEETPDELQLKNEANFVFVCTNTQKETIKIPNDLITAFDQWNL